LRQCLKAYFLTIVIIIAYKTNSQAAPISKMVSRKRRGEIYHAEKRVSDPVDFPRRLCNGWKTELQNKKCICNNEDECKRKMIQLIENNDDKRCALVTVFKGPLLATIRDEFSPLYYIPNEKILIRPHHFRDEDLLPNNKGPINGKLPVLGASLEIVVEEQGVAGDNEEMPDSHQLAVEASMVQFPRTRNLLTKLTPKKMVLAASLLVK